MIKCVKPALTTNNSSILFSATMYFYRTCDKNLCSLENCRKKEYYTWRLLQNAPNILATLFKSVLISLEIALKSRNYKIAQ